MHIGLRARQHYIQRLRRIANALFRTPLPMHCYRRSNTQGKPQGEQPTQIHFGVAKEVVMARDTVGQCQGSVLTVAIDQLQ